MTEKITSLQNPRIKKAIKLHSSRGRKTQDRMILFGLRQIARAASSGVEFEELFVSDSIETHQQDVVNELAKGTNAEIYPVTQELFTKLTYGDFAGEVVAVAQRPSSGLSEIVLSDPAIVLIAQAIEKPGNLGAILRSADACGVTGVILVDAGTDFYHPNSIRSSTGAVFQLQTASTTSKNAKRWLAENSFSVFTAQLENATDFFESELTGNVAIVVGNEAQGLDHQWQDESFSAVRLPMQGIADSLNVSVSASVMLYEASRQRRASSTS